MQVGHLERFDIAVGVALQRLACVRQLLALYGQYDWFESHDASLIARIVNSKSPGRATFIEVPRMDHHFTVYPTAQAALKEESGQVNPDPAVDAMLVWLAESFGGAGGGPSKNLRRRCEL
jgi:hypothetical protein